MKYTLKILLILTGSISPFLSKSQTTVIQDYKGESALNIGTKSVVSINSKNESLSFSWSKLLLDTTLTNMPILNHLSYAGFSVQGKGKNGGFNVLKGDEFQYDGSVGGFYTYSMLPTSRSRYGFLQFNFAASYLFSQFKLYDNSLAYPDQIYNKNQSGYKLSINGNWLPKSNIIPFVIGIAFNGGQKNNTGDLAPYDISDYSVVSDPLTGKQRVIEHNSKSAYNLSEFKANLGYFNFNVDAGPKLFNQFLLLVHSRWSVVEERKPQWNPAIGLYITKKGAPLEAIAGLQFQAVDYFNTANSSRSRQERTILNLVAGFSF